MKLAGIVLCALLFHTDQKNTSTLRRRKHSQEM